MRYYAAIEFTWPIRPDEAALDCLIASLDNGSLTGVEDRGLDWRAFFDSGASRDRALASVEGLPLAAAARAIDVPDERWAERSQTALGLVRIGRIVVAPPWRATDAASDGTEGALVIVINPSMGCGTGHHASTRRCLSLLQTMDLEGRRVIDVGTGSGVLAIAAWRLGATHVDALDHDADAIASARENVDLNRAAGSVQVIEADFGSHAPDRSPCDGALANLTGATLVGRAGALAALVRTGGWLIAGGIESHEADDVAGALGAAGWLEVARQVEDGWVGLQLERATSPIGSRAS